MMRTSRFSKIFGHFPAPLFDIFFRFETQQKLKFEVYDSDSSSSNLSDHDFLGRSFTTLGEIVGASSGSFTRNLLRDE